VRHSVKWQREKCAITYCTLSGTLTLAPDQPPEKAMEKWQTIVATRMRKQEAKADLQAQPGPANNGGQGQPAKKPLILLDGVEISEDLFSRTCSFTTNWHIVGTTLKNILSVSNLFSKLTGADNFQQWQASMANSASNVRGFGKEAFPDSLDRIMDLCPGGEGAGQSILKARVPTQQVVLKAGLGAKEAVLKAIDKDQLGLILGNGVQKNVVDPAVSWVAYQIEVTIVEKDRVVRHKPLTGAPGTKPNTSAVAQQTPSLNQTLNKILGGSTWFASTFNVPDIIQRVSAPSVNCQVEGKAMRIGYRIPAIVFGVIGGVKATVIGHYPQEKVVSQVGGIPMYQMQWRTDYMLPNPPTGPIVLPANPAMQVDVS
jgi:hypothetical protein